MLHLLPKSIILASAYNKLLLPTPSKGKDGRIAQTVSISLITNKTALISSNTLHLLKTALSSQTLQLA